MKRLLFSFSILLAATLSFSGAPPDRLPTLTAPAEARTVMVITGQPPPAGGSCNTTTAFDSQTTADGGSMSQRTADEYARCGMRYVPASTFNLCGITVKGQHWNGISSRTYYAQVWALDGSNHFSTQQGSDSASVSGSSITSDTDVLFSFSTPIELAVSTAYAIVIADDGATAPDWPDYIAWRNSTTNENANGIMAYWTSNGATYNSDANKDFYFKLWQYE